MAVPPIRPKLKTAFKKARAISPLYTGGPVAVTEDGKRLLTCVGEDVLLTDIATGQELGRFTGDTESVTALCVSPSASHLLVFTSSLALHIYDLSSKPDSSKPIHPIRVIAHAHDAPVHVCKVDPTSTYLASGSADGIAKVWDIRRGHVTHVFKGHGGVVSALTFNYPRDPSSLTLPKMQLITASVDTRIRVFDLSAAASRSGGFKPEAVLEGHVSVPRGLDVSFDGKWLVSGGRDSVVLIWGLSSKPDGGNNLKSNKSKGKEKEFAPSLVHTIPVLERVEAVGLLSPDEDLQGSSSGGDRIRLYTAGEKGVVKIWDGREGSVLYTFGTEVSGDVDDQEEQRQIVDAIYVPATSSIISVHADQNLQFHSLSSKSLTRQLVGYNDEIVDATYLCSRPQDPSMVDSHLALATNSSLIRIYSATEPDARLLEGHTDIVLCLDHSVQGNILASGSKDRSVRLWAPLEDESINDGKNWGWGCVAVCEGHAESVGAVAMSRKADESRPRFMFTGSQDRTIKMWDLLSIPTTSEDGAIVKCKSLTTHKAHDKDINALDMAPNDRFLASGSQDKTAKIYEVEYIVGAGGAIRGEVKHVGTCKGHKRGVWTVRFGRAERVLATGSGDKTVRLWSLEDFSCVKTFEGHTNSVLRVDFLNAGMQMVSAASDGLVKVWNVREEECVATLDNHEDKVWALAVSRDERTIVSGAADSVVTFWEDCTQEQDAEKETKRAEMVLKEQDFTNYVALRDYRNAISLALAMEHPGRLFTLFKQLKSNDAEAEEVSLDVDGGAYTGHPAVDEVIRTMHGTELAKLLKYVQVWNAQARTSSVAQGVLFAIVKLRSAEDIMAAFSVTGFSEFGHQKTGAGSTALKELVDALIPYTERHLARMDRLVQESYVVDYLLSEMDDGMFDEFGEADGEDGMEVDGDWNGISV